MAPLTRARARASETGVRSIEEWAAPIRRSDSDSHHILSNIPAEIFLEIVNYICPISNHLEYESLHSTDVRNRRIHDLFNFALVCRFLASLVLPFAYQNLFLRPSGEAFDMEFPILGVDGGGRSFIPFCKSLAVGQVNAKLLAPHVRSCVLEDYTLTGIPLPKAASALFKTHVDALPAMSNLSALVLSRVPFTPSLLNHIKRLPRLKRLAIDCCDFSAVEPEQVRRMSAKLQSDRGLTSFRFLCRDSRQNFLLLKPDFHKIKELIPLLSESVTELCTDSWVFMRLLMNSSFSGGPPTTLLPLQTLRLHFVMSLPQLCEYLYDKLSETLTTLLIDVVSCPEPVAGNADPFTLSLLHLPHLRSLTCPPHMAYHLSGTHSLSHLTFNTRLSLASPDEKSFLSQSLSASEKWGRIDQYRGLEELALPYTYAMEVKEVKNEENEVGDDGAASTSGTDGGEGSSSSRGTTKVACRAKSIVETLAPELQLKRLTVIGDSGCVMGRREFETNVIETFSKLWRSTQLTELRFVDLVFEDFSAPSPPSSSSSSSSSASSNLIPIFTPTAKRDGSVPLPAHPPSSSNLSLFTPTPARTLSHLIELNAEDEHKDIVYTRYILSLLVQDRCFPALERLVFVGTRIGAGRRVGQGGVGGVGDAGGAGGGGGGEGGNSVDAGGEVGMGMGGRRVCLGSSRWSWVWRRDGGADGKQWRLVDEGDESDG
ncbi:hypothetical protein GYMLUDRAFT_265462 [Collybiopsis luxurians FD-317 M1]|uniref:Unplaced genomic scaffold GYMLUscaffold_96, whole genome shotgun sequence n=1 Tax=Collybiopsis luxurians FD-317 M1 TaxID=944289 RepID=A0A0D0BRS0_9AGAR|nr:hypothetical protein GYMLUDRAFT_265462 [Collybiopsis luxurians FD-317 M1]